MDQKLYEELRNSLKIDVLACKKEKDAGLWDEGIQHHRERVLAAVRNMQALQITKKRIGFLEFMFRQIPFMGKDLWVSQGFTALVVFGVLYLSLGGDLGYLGIRHIPLMLGVLAVVLVMASVPLMLRSYQYRMYEIEMTSRQSMTRLLAAELILLSIEALAVFGVCAGISAGMAKLSAVKAVLYFLLPLLVAGTGCVQLIRRTGEWEEISWRIGICEGYCALLVLALVCLYSMRPAVYDRIGAWGLCTVCVFPLFALSICMWIRESARVDG